MASKADRIPIPPSEGTPCWGKLAINFILYKGEQVLWSIFSPLEANGEVRAHAADQAWGEPSGPAN
jgi:hypothetical protein